MEARPRRSVNLSLSAEVLEAAREARVNLSALLERELTRELGQLRRERWREENADAILAYNRYLASHRTCFEIQLDE